MIEIPRRYFQLACCELGATLLYLAVNMHSGDDPALLGYTPIRFVLLSFLCLLCLVFCVPGYLLITDTYKKLGTFLRHQLQQNSCLSHFVTTLLSLSALSSIFLLAAKAAQFSQLSNRYNILWLCILLLSLQTLILACNIRQVKFTLQISHKINRISSHLKNLNLWGFELEHPSLRQWLTIKVVQTIILVLVYLIYVQFVFHPGETGIHFRYGFSAVILLSFILLSTAFSVRGWSGIFLGLSATLIIFGLPLAGLWSGAFNESSIFRGLIPWSDANSYFIDANRLLDGGLLQYQSARRPLFTGFLAVLLGITKYNLQSALMLLVSFNALSCYLAAREVQQTHGRLASTMLLIILFLFYRRYTGTTLTENLGFALGASGFALLWRGAWEKQKNTVLAGISITTLALNSRSGAYFTLPVLVIWASILFRDEQRYSKNMLFLGLSAMIVSFALNMLVYRTVSNIQSTPESNFSNVLYGLANGGEPWDRVYTDHPDIASLSEPEHSQRIYKLAIDTFKSSPFKTVQGMYKGWQYFFDFDKGLFNFIRSAYFDNNYLIFRWAVYLFSFMAIIRFIFKRHEANTSLVMASVTGIIFSVPFTPLWDAAYMRLYAASIPFLAALPILGLTWIVKAITPQDIPLFTGHDNTKHLHNNSTLGYSILLMAIAIFGPILIKTTSHIPEFKTFNCSVEQEAIVMRVNPGSYLNIVHDEQIDETWVPDIHHSNFISGNNYDFPDDTWLEMIKEIKPSTSLLNNYDMLTGYDTLLFIGNSLLPPGNHIIGFCGMRDTNSNTFFAQSAQIIDQ